MCVWLVVENGIQIHAARPLDYHSSHFWELRRLAFERRMEELKDEEFIVAALSTSWESHQGMTSIFREAYENLHVTDAINMCIFHEFSCCSFFLRRSLCWNILGKVVDSPAMRNCRLLCSGIVDRTILTSCQILQT
jgi:hypothetical protein